MGKSVRMFMTMSEEEFASFERAREKLGMNRSQYVRYLIGGQKEVRPLPIRQKELISYIAALDRDMKAIAMKEELEPNDRIFIMAKLDDVKKLLGQNLALDNLSRRKE